MDINISIPTTWNELSESQFINIADQLENYQSIVKDNAEAITETAAKLFLQLSKEIIRENKWKAIRIALQEIQPKDFAPHLKFIYEGVKRTRFIPSVTINDTIYHSPDIRMRNSTIAEFAFADVAYYKWKTTLTPIWLDVLCATLYREQAEKPSDIDNRKTYIKQAVDNRADAFENLDRKTKLAIAYTYEGCRNHISDTYPLIFPKPIIVEGQEPTKSRYVSFGEIILDKIQGDPAKLEITNNVNLYDFLSIYNKDINDLRKQRN